MKVLGVVDKTFAGTARLDASSRTLYLTKVTDDALTHGLYAFQVDSGTLRTVSQLTSQGVSFSGLQVLPDASVLFSQQEKSESIGMVRLDP